MRRILQSSAVIFLLSCNYQEPPTRKTAVNDSVRQINGNADRFQHYTKMDTLVIATETDDTLRFSKDRFNQIVDEHPEFYQEFIPNPDYLYHYYGESGDFGSEVGQDTYFALYAYFLKQRNGGVLLSEKREKLIQIYLKINSLFDHFQYGGTYFGHQRMRILGYAEFSVSLYPKGEKSSDTFEKTYDIRKQKELYINSLRQLIMDESSIDMNTLGIEKQARSKELYAVVDDLNRLITDIFYLRRAQAFQYEYYEYY